MGNDLTTFQTVLVIIISIIPLIWLLVIAVRKGREYERAQDRLRRLWHIQRLEKDLGFEKSEELPSDIFRK